MEYLDTHPQPIASPDIVANSIYKTMHYLKAALLVLSEEEKDYIKLMSAIDDDPWR